MAKPKTPPTPPAPPAFDKTNTCSVNVSESKKEKGKQYSFFNCNLNGFELKCILNSKGGEAYGFLKQKPEDKEWAAKVNLKAVSQNSPDAPSFRGTIETKKGNRFDVALWEQFSEKYHFWSGKIQPEGEYSAEDDGTNPFVLSYRPPVERNTNSSNTNATGGEADDLPF